MKLPLALLTPALAATFAVSAALAQQAAKPAEELPDAPAATGAVLTRPNGPTVVMDTSMGRITCQFYQQQAPKAVANFIALAEGTKDWTDPVTNKKQSNKPFYDGTIFHRVIPEFMIQGGDPAGTGMGNPGYTFEDEFDPNLNFDRPGRLAMANYGPNTNGAQFFITEQAQESLNQRFTLFGQCDEASLAVVKGIARVERDSNDKPLTPVVLKKVTIVREGQPLPADPEATELTKSLNVPKAVMGGILQQKTNPIYPIAARQAGVSGTVVLNALIGTDGLVKDLKVVSGPALLQKAALDAVKTWRYIPFLLNGQPIEVRTLVNVNFTLGSK
jgi:peptidyl-prolyl cis-trans isomerase A (cyclophilin A)